MKGYIRPSSGNREVSSSQIFGDKAVEATLPESRIMQEKEEDAVGYSQTGSDSVLRVC